jgi:hypothetical protein
VKSQVREEINSFNFGPALSNGMSAKYELHWGKVMVNCSEHGNNWKKSKVSHGNEDLTV